MFTDADLVEMRAPGKQSCGDYIGAPGDRVPAGVLAQPAMDQRPRRLARLGADADQIGNPAEAVPFGEPFLAAFAARFRRQTPAGKAHQSPRYAMR